jgi:hypothetical protein
MSFVLTNFDNTFMSLIAEKALGASRAYGYGVADPGYLSQFLSKARVRKIVKST